MGLEMGGEGVEGLLHQGVVGDAGRLPPAQPAEEGAAEAVGGEEPVQIAAHDPAVARACTVRPACKGDQRPRRIRSRGLPHVHLVARDRLATFARVARCTNEALALAHHRFDIEQAEPRSLPRRPLDAGRVGDAVAQHLVAAAEAHQPAAAPHVRG